MKINHACMVDLYRNNLKCFTMNEYYENCKNIGCSFLKGY